MSAGIDKPAQSPVQHPQPPLAWLRDKVVLWKNHASWAELLSVGLSSSFICGSVFQAHTPPRTPNQLASASPFSEAVVYLLAGDPPTRLLHIWPILHIMTGYMTLKMAPELLGVTLPLTLLGIPVQPVALHHVPPWPVIYSNHRGPGDLTRCGGRQRMDGRCTRQRRHARALRHHRRPRPPPRRGVRALDEQRARVHA